ncbi:MAG: hypothetical protein CVV49_11290 [Spirochaetae bacterium HGW-Spirochaetae-5]|nr:MAG: hypothetical protein CVV49_11290 [Spirochaetae bacterium HGW-Spirochaetae-5]
MKRYIEIIVRIIESRNLVPKLASILLAVILWAYISSEKSGEVKFKLPVNFSGLEEDYIVSKISHKYVVVEIKGNKDDLKNVSSKNIKLQVDLANSETGDYKPYKIEYQKIDFTDDFKVDLYPEEVKVLIEKKLTRDVRVIPRYSGYTDKGFMIGRIRVNPEYIKVTGPGSIIKNISSVYTEEISVDDRDASFRQDIKIEKVNEAEIEYSQSKVNAIVPVLNFSEKTTFEIPVIIRNKKKGYKYLFNADRVKISVIIPENKNISEDSFSAYIDGDEIQIDNDEFIRKSRVEVMGNIHIHGDSSEIDNLILSGTPDSVEIVVTKE